MNKIIVFLATILSFVACSNSVETISISEECEVITVYHNRTGRMLFTDTLTDNHIIYTEKGVNDYALSNIPENFFDNQEEYIVVNKYFNNGEKTQEDQYELYYYDLFRGLMPKEETPFSGWKYRRI